MDYNELRRGAVMGAAKPVFKTHGSAKAKRLKNALRLDMSISPEMLWMKSPLLWPVNKESQARRSRRFNGRRPKKGLSRI